MKHIVIWFERKRKLSMYFADLSGQFVETGTKLLLTGENSPWNIIKKKQKNKTENANLNCLHQFHT